MVEYLYGKQKVAGSIPVKGFFFNALVAKWVNAVVRGAIVDKLMGSSPIKSKQKYFGLTQSPRKGIIDNLNS